MKKLQTIALGFLGALLAIIAVNSPRAYAQAMSSGSSAPTAVQVLAVLLGQDVSVNKLTATAAAGETAFQIANDGAKFCFGSLANWCVGADLSTQVLNFPGGLQVGAGQNVIFDSWFPKQSTVPPVIQGTKGFRSVCVSEANFAAMTCGDTTAPENTSVCITATATSRTRTCTCKRLGSSGAWRWKNEDDVYGSTTTDCAEIAL